ncbi:hypothetical protein [Streptomyces buecherae]|uniref:hypothetical protein n=1 Tax=Streptomyces buecherae TaxID=2763006 RepID=UPI003667D134
MSSHSLMVSAAWPALYEPAGAGAAACAVGTLNSTASMAPITAASRLSAARFRTTAPPSFESSGDLEKTPAE